MKSDALQSGLFADSQELQLEPQQDEKPEPRQRAAEDVVSIYLQQMGRVPLLSREQERALAQRIEAVEMAFRADVLRLPRARPTLLALLELLLQGETALGAYFKDGFRPGRDDVMARVVKLRKKLKRTNSGKGMMACVEESHPLFPCSSGC